jgi:hypothetical protein
MSLESRICEVSNDICFVIYILYYYHIYIYDIGICASPRSTSEGSMALAINCWICQRRPLPRKFGGSLCSEEAGRPRGDWSWSFQQSLVNPLVVVSIERPRPPIGGLGASMQPYWQGPLLCIHNHFNWWWHKDEFMEWYLYWICPLCDRPQATQNLTRNCTYLWLNLVWCNTPILKHIHNNQRAQFQWETKLCSQKWHSYTYRCLMKRNRQNLNIQFILLAWYGKVWSQQYTKCSPHQPKEWACK